MADSTKTAEAKITPTAPKLPKTRITKYWETLKHTREVYPQMVLPNNHHANETALELQKRAEEVRLVFYSESTELALTFLGFGPQHEEVIRNCEKDVLRQGGADCTGLHYEQQKIS